MADGETRRGWRALDRDTRRWLLVNAVIVGALVNLVVNAAIGWINTIGSHQVAIWSIPGVQRVSVFTNALGTFFFLPLTTTVLFSRVVYREQRRSSLPRSTDPLGGRRAWIPSSLVRRGLLLGLITCAVLTPVTAVVIGVVSPGDPGRAAFEMYAIGLGVGLGLVVTPLVGVLALADKTAQLSLVTEGLDGV